MEITTGKSCNINKFSPSRKRYAWGLLGANKYRPRETYFASWLKSLQLLMQFGRLIWNYWVCSKQRTLCVLCQVKVILPWHVGGFMDSIFALKLKSPWSCAKKKSRHPIKSWTLIKYISDGTAIFQTPLISPSKCN